MAKLSARENEVLRLVARGHRNKEVAAKLEVSTQTVDTYRSRAMVKLKLSSRVELVRYALEQGG
jgi:DNA-binding NarL/FixJ family response regulator